MLQQLMTSYLFYIKSMVKYRYQNNRFIPDDANILFNFRPSGLTRLIKGTLQYSFFQVALTYGFAFNGFGLQSYFLQTTGTQISYAPWARMKLLGSQFSKYFILSLPFYYAKEFCFSLNYKFTNDKPKLRKLLSYSFINNIFAFGSILPLFYLFQKNVIKSLRGALVLCTFSMFVDAFIEFRRKQLTNQNLSFDQKINPKIHANLQHVKAFLENSLTSSKERKQLEKVDWKVVEDQIINNRKITEEDLEILRNKQLQQVSIALKKQFQSFQKWFS